MSAGVVYVLTNEAMPGYVKIGLTRSDSVRDRMKTLDGTAVPLPFECYYAARVPDCASLERTLHFVFGENRKRANREFFNIRPDLAKAIIQLVATEEVTLSDAEQSIDKADREEIEKIRTRRANRTFSALNVPIGAPLVFTKDPAVTATVASDRTLTFLGTEQSVTATALTAVRRMGYDWSSCNGWDYWTYNGQVLSGIGSDPPLSISERPQFSGNG